MLEMEDTTTRCQDRDRAEEASTTSKGIAAHLCARSHQRNAPASARPSHGRSSTTRPEEEAPTRRHNSQLSQIALPVRNLDPKADA